MRIKIDHNAVVDGHRLLSHQRWYEDVERPCSRCGALVRISASLQKDLFEKRKLPVKALDAAAFCPRCLPKQRAKNRDARERSRLNQSLKKLQAEHRSDPKSWKKARGYLTAHVRLLELERDPQPRAAKRLAQIAESFLDRHPKDRKLQDLIGRLAVLNASDDPVAD